jgi:hypothetical protein
VIDIDAEAKRRNSHLKPAFLIRPDTGTVMRTLDLRTHLT